MSAIGNVIMGKFGENLLTAKYKTWERMRRFIAPLINERISSTVFQESKTQVWYEEAQPQMSVKLYQLSLFRISNVDLE